MAGDQLSVATPPLELLQTSWLPHIHDFVRRVVRSIPPGRTSAQLTLSSWFRDARTNQLVGGDPDSQHLFALAADFTGPRIVLEQVALLAQLNGLVAVLEPGHLHVQRHPAGLLSRLGVRFPVAAV